MKNKRAGHTPAHRNNKKSGEKIKRPWVKIIVAALLASAISIGLILLYSMFLYLGFITVDTVPAAGIAIKAVGALIAGFLAVRGEEKSRLLKGSISGGVYILIAFIVFSILSESLNVDIQLLLDIGMGLLAGALAAMLYGALKKKG